MMRKVSAYILCVLISAWATSSLAEETHGYINTGFWFMKNDLASNPTYTATDGYGNSYVQGDFGMFNADATIDFLHLNDPRSKTDISVHLKGRFLDNVLGNPYTLAPDDKYRYQADEANVEINSGSTDILIGRHTIYESGGVGVDGITAIFSSPKHFGLGVFGGLGNDPRTLTGYIGPTYRTIPFNSDFLTGGAFTKIHYDRFQMDNGINTIYFHHSVDRSDFYTQFNWLPVAAWTFSGYLDLGFMGDKGIQRGLLAINTKVTKKLTNRFSFSEFRSVFYAASDAGGIPVPATFNAAFPLGTVVNTSEYYYVRDEVQYRFDRNYFFTGLEHGHRTYDGGDREKYFLGYYDPVIFDSPYDFRIQTDIIDNYLSFNTDIDIILGRNFYNDKFRAEIGGTFYANERDTRLNNAVTAPSGEVEKETTARINLQWNMEHNISWLLNYAYYTEVDVVNNNDHVHTHEIYVSSNLRF